MEKKVKKSRLAGVPAWALSLMTFFSSIGIFELFELLPSIPDSQNGFDLELIIVVLVYAVFLTTACFFICKTYPRSVWYTPFICNGFILFILISSGFSNPEWPVMILLSACIVLSVIGTFVGAKIGQRKINQTDNG